MFCFKTFKREIVESLSILPSLTVWGLLLEIEEHPQTFKATSESKEASCTRVHHLEALKRRTMRGHANLLPFSLPCRFRKSHLDLISSNNQTNYSVEKVVTGVRCCYSVGIDLEVCSCSFLRRHRKALSGEERVVIVTLFNVEFFGHQILVL